MLRTGMMTLVALLALSACGDGQPFTFETDTPEPPDPDPTSPIPATVAGNVSDVAWTPPSPADPDGTLLVQISALDTTPITAEYDRNIDLDVPGYTAYSIQEDPLDRMFIGMVAQSADGAVMGALVMDGGQFTKYFGGTFYEQTDGYTAHDPEQPDNGLVSYAGTYIGMLNLNAPRPNEALPIPAGVDPALWPEQAARVVGEVFLNADFSDNTVNGAIYNRNAMDYGAILPNIFLIPDSIAANGSFAGEVEDAEQVDIGDYAGTFGGTGATSVAGGIRLVGDFIDEIDGVGVTNEEEYGIFVLNMCGQAGDSAICDDVDP